MTGHHFRLEEIVSPLSVEAKGPQDHHLLDYIPREVINEIVEIREDQDLEPFQDEKEPQEEIDLLVGIDRQEEIDHITREFQSQRESLR